MSIAAERRALEETYEGVCTISQSVSKKIKGETVTEDKVIVENEPCALSHERNSEAKQSEISAEAGYVGRLFISPELVIEAGSKIMVEQCGRVYQLEASSIAAVYPTHQEINIRQEVKA